MPSDAGQVLVRTSEGAFGLKMLVPDEPWQLLYAEPTSIDLKTNETGLNQAELFFKLAIAIDTFDLATMAESSNLYKVSNWIDVKNEKGELRCQFDVESLQPTNRFERLQVIVDPAHGYRIDQYQFLWTNDNLPSTVTLTYDDDVATVVPKLVHYEYAMRRGVPTFEIRCEIVESSFAPPPAEVFTLEHYGVSAIKFGGPSFWTSTTFFVTIAAAFAIAALFFAYRQNAMSNAP